MAVSAARSERVTVTMPAELVAGIDRHASNRSRFIAEAVRQELKRRRRQALLQSLDDLHPDSLETAAIGVQAWGEGVPEDDGALLDPAAGVPLHWLPGEGWQEPAS